MVKGGCEDYHIVECCFYCDSCKHRERAGGDCIKSGKRVETGGICSDFTWAADNEWRLPGYARPPEAQQAIDAYYEGIKERRRQKEEAHAAQSKQAQIDKIVRDCPIAKTGVPDNPCRSCDKKEICPVGSQLTPPEEDGNEAE